MGDRSRWRPGTRGEREGEGEEQKPLRPPDEGDDRPVEELIREEVAEEDAERRGVGPYGNGDRGRDADSPGDMPPRAWRDVAKRTLRRLGRDNVALVGAGVAFYFFFALFPALAALFSLYGLVSDPSRIQDTVRNLHALPADVLDIVASQLQVQAERPASTLGLSFALTLGVALWSIRRGMSSLILAMNIAYVEAETRSFLRVTLLGVVFSVGALVMAVVAAVAIGLLPAVLTRFELGVAGRWATAILTWALLLGVFVVGLAVVYRYGPARADARWRWITPGAALAVVTWFLASAGFALYLANFGNYDRTYGSLGGVAVLLFWLWISGFLVVAGAELDAELELQTARDTTTHGPHPMGERGAYVADHVGPVP